MFFQIFTAPELGPLLRLQLEGEEKMQTAGPKPVYSVAGPGTKAQPVIRSTTKEGSEETQAEASACTEERLEAFGKVQLQTYNSRLRIANASYIKVPVDYYVHWRGIWCPPMPSERFDDDHRFALKISK